MSEYVIGGQYILSVSLKEDKWFSLDVSLFTEFT